ASTNNTIERLDIDFFNDDNNTPGSLITGFNEILSFSQTFTGSGTLGGTEYNFYTLEVILPSPITVESFATDSKYWIGISRALSDNGISIVLMEAKASNGTTVDIYGSSNDGISWSIIEGYDGVFEMSGICEY